MPWKRTKQYRLPGYDYASNGAYFITIVTKNRLSYLGEITDGKMNLSVAGNYLQECILHLNAREDLEVTEFEIMPNHVHLILLLKHRAHVSDRSIAAFGPLVSNSISAIINRLKGRVKRWCDENGSIEFEWQSRFHDRIIRDDAEYVRIAEYIRNNVANWRMDGEYLSGDD